MGYLPSCPVHPSQAMEIRMDSIDEIVSLSEEDIILHVVNKQEEKTAIKTDPNNVAWDDVALGTKGFHPS
jgi:hypothetical protein